MTVSKSLENLLLQEMSRRNADLVVDLIRQKPELFHEIFKIYLSNEEPVSRRAAWVIDIITDNMPELLLHKTELIVANLDVFKHDGLKRHSLRMIAKSPLPRDEILGKLINICFTWLLCQQESVAVKVHSMDILYQISKTEPALKKELADSISWRLSEETPGFKNKGLKLLRNLYSEIELLKID
jgi:hypothetical protein